MPGALKLFLACIVLAATGCVERTISITSEPPGALVWLNEREVGRTPVDVEFLTYGTYDVRLQLADHEPLATSGDAKVPWWEIPPLDLLAAASPFTFRRHVKWHFDLEPARSEPGPLKNRALELRGAIEDDEEGDQPDS
ncbi:MAG: PEGA domain-containing protein [Planctomycetota bacterium]